MTTLDTRDNFPIKLNGVHYEINLSAYRRNTIDATRQMTDQTTENSESTLNSPYLWKRSGGKFTSGAGQATFDETEFDSRFRFRDSFNVNPWGYSFTPFSKDSALFMQPKCHRKIANPVHASGLSYYLNSGSLFVIDEKIISVRNFGDRQNQAVWYGYSIDSVNAIGSDTTASYTNIVTSGFVNDSIVSAVSDGFNLYYNTVGATGATRGYFVSGTWTTTAFGNSASSYDNLMVVGNNVFAHVPNILDFTKGMSILLKKNGSISTPSN